MNKGLLNCGIMLIIFIVSVNTADAIEEDFFGKDRTSPFYVSPVVNVIISGSDPRHLEETLSKLVSLSRKVPVRNVVIYDKHKNLEKLSYQHDLYDSNQEVLSKLGIPSTKNPYSNYFKELRLSSREMKAGTQLLERLKISYSPTWIVRYEGKDYIYEGYPDITKMFTRNGSFIPK